MPKYFENYDLDNIITLVKGNLFAQMLRNAGYNENKTCFIEDSFTNGFDIGYEGPEERQSLSSNIPLKVGSRTELWNKLMKEVKLKRVAGPFKTIPYDNFIQSLIGLVPKAG